MFTFEVSLICIGPATNGVVLLGEALATPPNLGSIDLLLPMIWIRADLDTSWLI